MSSFRTVLMGDHRVELVVKQVSDHRKLNQSTDPEA